MLLREDRQTTENRVTGIGLSYIFCIAFEDRFRFRQNSHSSSKLKLFKVTCYPAYNCPIQYPVYKNGAYPDLAVAFLSHIPPFNNFFLIAHPASILSPIPHPAKPILDPMLHEARFTVTQHEVRYNFNRRVILRGCGCRMSFHFTTTQTSQFRLSESPMG